jgi:hypothetical protein
MKPRFWRGRPFRASLEYSEFRPRRAASLAASYKGYEDEEPDSSSAKALRWRLWALRRRKLARKASAKRCFSASFFDERALP